MAKAATSSVVWGALFGIIIAILMFVTGRFLDIATEIVIFIIIGAVLGFVIGFAWDQLGKPQYAAVILLILVVVGVLIIAYAIPPQNGLFLGKENIIYELDLVISMDSVLLHLAGTTNTPTFGIFGPSSPKKYLPLSAKHRYFSTTCPFGHLFQKRCSFLRICKRGSCLKDIKPEDIFRKYYDQTPV